MQLTGHETRSMTLSLRLENEQLSSQIAAVELTGKAREVAHDIEKAGLESQLASTQAELAAARQQSEQSTAQMQQFQQAMLRAVGSADAAQSTCMMLGVLPLL